MILVTTSASTQEGSQADPEGPNVTLVKKLISNAEALQKDSEGPNAILVDNSRPNENFIYKLWGSEPDFD